MLVYQENGDILALLREAIECGFDVCVLRFRIHYEEVLLRVRGLRNVLRIYLVSGFARSCGEAYANACQQHAGDSVLGAVSGELVQRV